MSRITTYPIISTVAQDDLLVISDVSSSTFPTKSVTVQQLVGGSTAPLALTVNGTSGAATLINNVLNIPQYIGGVSRIIAGTNVTISPSGGTGAVTINASGGGGGGISTVSATGKTGPSSITGTNLNVPDYNRDQLVFGFTILTGSGNPNIMIGRNTFTPTLAGSGDVNWSIAADGGTVGSFTITASAQVFSNTSSGNYLTHFTIMDPNLTTPSSGTGTLPRIAIAKVTSTTTFNLSFFQGQSGNVLGQRIAPANADLKVTVMVSRYPLGW